MYKSALIQLGILLPDEIAKKVGKLIGETIPQNKFFRDLDLEVLGIFYSIDPKWKTEPIKLSEHLAENGKLFLLKQLEAKVHESGIQLDYTIIAAVAGFRGHKDVFDWAINNKKATDLDYTKIISAAVAGGHLIIVQDLYKNYKDIIDLGQVARIAGLWERIRIIDWLKKTDIKFLPYAAYAAASNGRDKLIKYIQSIGGEDIDINFEVVAMNGAYSGYPSVVKLAFKNNFNDSNAIAIAGAVTGHREIILTALELGANNYDDIISTLVDYRQYSLALTIIGEIGETNISQKVLNMLPQDLIGDSGVEVDVTDQDLVNWFYVLNKDWQEFPDKLASKLAKIGNVYALDKLAFLFETHIFNYNVIAAIGAKNGHFDVTYWAVKKGISVFYTIDYGKIARAAIKSEHLYVLLQMKEVLTNIDILNLAYVAGFYGRMRALELILESENNEQVLTNFVLGAASNGRVRLIGRFCKIYKCNIDYNKLAEVAAYNGHYSIIKKALTKGITNYEDVAYAAATAGHIGIVKILLTNGGQNVYDIIIVLARMYYFDKIIQLLKH